jgi:hypothetical protein
MDLLKHCLFPFGRASHLLGIDKYSSRLERLEYALEEAALVRVGDMVNCQCGDYGIVGSRWQRVCELLDNGVWRPKLQSHLGLGEHLGRAIDEADGLWANSLSDYSAQNPGARSEIQKGRIRAHGSADELEGRAIKRVETRDEPTTLGVVCLCVPDVTHPLPERRDAPVAWSCSMSETKKASRQEQDSPEECKHCFYHYAN